MDDAFLWPSLVGFGMVVGLIFGHRAERRSWTMRAINGKGYNSTPHHCDGEFYYVITEKHFCEEFQRRAKEI